MTVLEVVRVRGGWAVQSGCALTAPLRSQTAAIAQAKRLAEAIRQHGETVVVTAASSEDTDTDPVYFVPSAKTAAAARLRAPKRVLRVG